MINIIWSIIGSAIFIIAINYLAYYCKRLTVMTDKTHKQTVIQKSANIKLALNEFFIVIFIAFGIFILAHFIFK